jgi:hypothetical protein
MQQSRSLGAACEVHGREEAATHEEVNPGLDPDSSRRFRDRRCERTVVPGAMPDNHDHAPVNADQCQFGAGI